MANFLIDEDLPRSTKKLLEQYGHRAVYVRDVELRGAKDAIISAYAQKYSLCLLTGDFDFADIRNYPPSHYSGIVVLTIPKNSTASMILNLITGLLHHPEVMKQLSGNLIIVESNRIRIRKDDRTVGLEF